MAYSIPGLAIADMSTPRASALFFNSAYSFGSNRISNLFESFISHLPYKSTLIPYKKFSVPKMKSWAPAGRSIPYSCGSLGACRPASCNRLRSHTRILRSMASPASGYLGGAKGFNLL
jgi:hypothetical protein